MAGRRGLAGIIGVCLALALAGCGGNKGSSSSGGGTTTVNANGIELLHAPAGTEVVGPNLNGNAWKGYLETANGRVGVSAVVRHIGAGVVIRTTRTSGIAREFIGSITSGGSLTLTDTFDNQTWTSMNGPASSRKIRIFDFTFVDNHKGKTNILELTQ